MLARYREVVETVLRFRESKERLIRRAVISLLPKLAAFAPERFAATYLKQCTNYLLSVLKFPSERGVGRCQRVAVQCTNFRSCCIHSCNLSEAVHQLPAVSAQVPI